MRLALFNQFYRPDLSPTAQLAASLVDHRVSLGDEVTVVAGSGAYVVLPADDESSPSRPPTANPKVLRLWTPSLGKDGLVRRLLDYLAFYVQAAIRALALPAQDTMILMTTPPFVALVGLLHKALHPGTRLVLWNMDCYPETAERAGMIPLGGFASRCLRWLNRQLYRRLEAVVSLDRAMQELLVSSYVDQGRPPVHVLSNWEPVSLFPPGWSPPEWKDARPLGLEGRLVVLYLGNAGSGHDFETILNAAAQLADEPASFLFVGGGSAWPVIESGAQKRHLQNVVLRGYVPKQETPSVLALAHVALITLRDSMLGVMSPSKLGASLAMGLPILYLGPEGGNVDDAIRRFGCGVSLRHGDVDETVAFIRKLRSDSSFQAELRRRARRAFEQGYSDLIALPRFDAVIAGSASKP